MKQQFPIPLTTSTSVFIHDSRSSRVHVASNGIKAQFGRLSRNMYDRRSIGRAARSTWRVTNPANHETVIDIEPRGGYRVDTIGSAPGVSPACTIYNVNIPEPGSTLFSRPFYFVSRFILPLRRVFLIYCASRERRRPIIPCISSSD